MWRTKRACVGYLVIVCLLYLTVRLFSDGFISAPGANSLTTTSFLRRHDWYNYNTYGNHCVPTSTTPSFIVCTHRPIEDIYISDQLLSSGIWEPDMTRLLQNLLNTANNATFVDIGANIGYFSLLAAAMGHVTVAVEPVQTNIDKLEKAVVLNNLQNKITILNSAISNVRQYLRLTLSSNNQGAHRLLGPAEFPDSRNVSLVRSRYLDDILSLIPTKDVILKIDVEGHECRTLERSTQLFRHHRVPYILTEWGRMTKFRNIYGVPCPGRSIQSIADMLSDREYQAFDIQTNEMLDISESHRWVYGDVYWVQGDNSGGLNS